MKKKILIGIFTALLLVTVGCSNKEEPKKEVAKQEHNQTSKIKQNKELTKKVKEEKGVINGQVYVQGKMAIGTLVLDKNVSNNDAKVLAKKYVDELKRKYKGMKINVQAVRNGKNVANIIDEE